MPQTSFFISLGEGRGARVFILWRGDKIYGFFMSYAAIYFDFKLPARGLKTRFSAFICGGDFYFLIPNYHAYGAVFAHGFATIVAFKLDHIAVLFGENMQGVGTKQSAKK